MRTITGCIRTTLTHWLPVLSDIQPLELRRQEALKREYKKFMSNRLFPINDYITAASSNRLKSRCPAIKTAKTLYEENFNMAKSRELAWNQAVPAECGFRKHRSTVNFLASVTHMRNRANENHGKSRVVALDISKAFYRVWHERLLAKLAAHGLPLGLRQWLNSFLND
nr:unnamed protein product [Callosobruchus analis]